MTNKNTRLKLNKIFCEDCVKGMSKIPNESIDLIVTDPPFAIDFKAQRSNYNRTRSRVLEGYGEIQRDKYYNFTKAWVEQAHRCLKNYGSMYVFSGWNNLKDILNALDEVGFITVNHLIWKYQFGVVTRRKFVTSHYHCLYVCKNDKHRKFFPFARYTKDERHPQGGSMHYKDKEDVWVINREYWTGDQKTPTKLPREVIEKILQYSSDKGDVILDPFLGSGQTAVVSKMMGRKYVGFEIVPEYYKFASTRLKKNQYRIKAK